MKPKRVEKRSEDRYFSRKQDSKRRKVSTDEEESADIKYLRQIESRLKGTFDDEEEKELFISNVLKQIHDTFWDISCDKNGSRILEKLLPLTNIDQIQPVTEIFKSNFRKACIHLNASHVTQSLLRRIYELVINDDKENDEESKEKKEILRQWLISLATFMLNNLTDFMCEPHASHVLRELMEFTIKEKNSSVAKGLFDEIVPKFVEQITQWKNLHDFLTDPSASGFLQILISVTQNQNQELCSKLIKFIVKQGMEMDNDEQNPNLSKFFCNENSSRVLEKIILGSSDGTFDKLLNERFKNQIREMAKHKIANFVLQKLIKSGRNPEHVKLILEEVTKVLNDIVQNGYFGIFVALAEACKEHKTQQKQFIEVLMTAFGCSGTEENQLQIFPSLVTMRSSHVADSSNFAIRPIKLQGSLILQHLFSFNRPQTIIKSMFNMQPSDLTHIACDKSGSFIFDAFVKSQLVGYKNKSKLIKILKGNYVRLTCSTYGSRCLENIWNNADLNDRSIIIQELSKGIDKLKTDRLGHIAIKKFGVSTFQYRRDEWTKIQKSQIKNTKMFNEILS